MTFAPASLQALRGYLIKQIPISGAKIGIVGDTAHAQKGVSYHLGRSQLTATAYSRQTARDRAGLSEAASAIDIGNHAGLRRLSVWLVIQARANALGTRDIREIIYSPDGVKVLRWDRERGVDSQPRPRPNTNDPTEADDSHRTHTHISYYRDSENRDKVSVFTPFYEPPEEPVLQVTMTGKPGSISIIPNPKNRYYDLATNQFLPKTGTYTFTSKDPATPVKTPAVSGITEWYLVGDDLALIPKQNAIYHAADCADEIEADRKKAHIVYT